MIKNKEYSKILSASDYLRNELNINVDNKIVNFEFPAHGHEFYEIEFAVSGEGVCVVNGKTFHLKKGSIYFVTPSDVHKVSKAQGADYLNVLSVQMAENVIDPNLMMSFLSIRSDECYYLEGDEYEYALNIFSSLYHEQQSNRPYKNICMKNLIENLVVLFLRNFFVKPAQDEKRTPIQKVLVYIHSRFKDGITLKEAAAYSGFTETYFSAVFKESTGVNFKQYIDNLRFEYAENLLKSTNLSITEVCYSSGFKSVSNFIKRFTKRFGISPVKFRAENK